MKILFMAPHPFYQERGTPIAVDLLLKCLSNAGHEIDVITFPEGEDRQYPGVKYHRVKPVGKIRGVRPGFSLKKLYLDFFVLLKFLSLMFRKRYDVVHAVEESVYLAMLICPLYRTPYIYDMDSSMVTQLIDKAPALARIEGFLRFLESLPARYAKVVVPCCDALANDAAPYRLDSDKPIITLKDISLLDKSRTQTSGDLDIQRLVNSENKSSQKVLMYIGNLEAYQGIDLMLQGFAEATTTIENIVLVIVGGEQQHIDEYIEKTKALVIQDKVFFLGKQPVTDLYALMLQANILLSPRTQGINTPMKVYSYLDSNVPVLATRLPTHTQVMSDENTLLVEPDALSFSNGIIRLINDETLCVELTKNASEFIQREHSFSSFEKKVNLIYDLL